MEKTVYDLSIVQKAEDAKLLKGEIRVQENSLHDLLPVVTHFLDKGCMVTIDPWKIWEEEE